VAFKNREGHKMKSNVTRTLGAVFAAGALAAMLTMTPAQAAGERAPFVPVGGAVRAPIGWTEFCAEHAAECGTKALEARDVVLTTRAWKELIRVNTLVNDAIKPVTDLEHWGVVERWDYPADGRGDCEDYVLLKRKRLMELGWPASALLITVVRDEKGEGHAVLTARTRQGDYILDNKTDEIRLWYRVQYRFVMRQSYLNPTVWMSLDPKERSPAMALAGVRAQK
jgi:predicted transglutaminase-like cysteine proteinase